MKTFKEENCTFTHQGQSFTNDGACVTEDGQVVAYVKAGRLTTWHGKDMGIGDQRIIEEWLNQDGERTYVVAFCIDNVAEDDTQCVVGYSFGEGGIFRGEICEKNIPWNTIKQQAREISKYWAELDAEEQANQEKD